MEKAQDRLDVLKKIEEYEKEGNFFSDVENDPQSREIKPGEVDYAYKKLSTKIKRNIANKKGRKFIQSLIESNQLILDDIIGLENLDNLKTGAVVTTNHFCFMDSFPMQIAYENTHFYKKKKLFKVIREGNYTSMTGLFGKLLKNCNTLPLSSNTKTMMEFMRATQHHLENGNLVMIYPEQSMWWYYKKPKPLKSGSYRLAINSNVPIVPTFITMQDSNILDTNGFYIQKLTLHIGKPIYPKSNLSNKDNMEYMKRENFKYWKKVYEETYHTKLDYTTTDRTIVQDYLDM